MKKHILDNEVSEEFKKAIKKNDAKHELVTPSKHLQNVAKRVIQMFKDHFIGVIARLNDTFLMHLWCRLLPQAEHQLNLLQQLSTTPNILAYAHVHGPHNLTKPFAPPQMPDTSAQKSR